MQLKTDSALSPHALNWPKERKYSRRAKESEFQTERPDDRKLRVVHSDASYSPELMKVTAGDRAQLMTSVGNRKWCAQLTQISWADTIIDVNNVIFIINNVK